MQVFKTRLPKSRNTAGDAVRGNRKVMQSESSRELPSLSHGNSQVRKRVVLTANEPRHVHTVFCARFCATKPPRKKKISGSDSEILAYIRCPRLSSFQVGHAALTLSDGTHISWSRRRKLRERTERNVHGTGCRIQVKRLFYNQLTRDIEKVINDVMLSVNSIL